MVKGVSAAFWCALVILRLFAVGASVPGSESANAASHDSVKWEELREVIARTIGASADGRPLFGIRPERPPSGDVQKSLFDAVNEAFVEAQPVISGLFAVPSYLTRPLSESPSGVASAEEVRRALLANSDFLRLIIPKVERALRDKGLTCKDVPHFESSVPRSIPWREASKFLQTFVSIRGVQSLDEQGATLKHPKVSFKVCTGDEGQDLAHSDPTVAAAMFTVALDMQPLVAEMIHDTLRNPAYIALTTDEARTTFLREEVKQRLAFDGDVLSHTCEVLGRVAKDVKLWINECDVNPVPTAPPKQGAAAPRRP